MIRAYAENDLDELLNTWAAASALAHPFLSAEFQQRERGRIPAMYLPNAETWVWESAGQVVAFIALIGDEIGGLFVHPKCQRRGIGRRLIDHARACRGDLTVQVFCENKLGVPFYKRCGFTVSAQRTHEESGHELFTMTLPRTA